MDMEAGKRARLVLQSVFSGVLSTHSKKYPGFPFGSVVPFCLDETGQPLILISRLAQHTQNIADNAKVSLTLLESNSEEGDIQQVERLTLLAEAEAVAEVDQAAQRYYRCFPQARGYHDELDFDFYRLNLVQLRFIEGFGQARWLSPGDTILANPFTAEQLKRIVDHMNEDHADAIQHYSELAAIPNPAGDATMAAIDSEGMTLRVANRLHRVEFERSVTTSEEARAILVEMARTPIRTQAS
ncbi:MAG: heme iron utilization protein [Pseudomonadales bacterium]|nr:heme iron utilization protein [Pseudomonadales bacterium]